MPTNCLATAINIATMHTPSPISSASGVPQLGVARAGSATARHRLAADRGGAVLIETALILPLLVMFLFGIVSWGIWFMAAHGIQEAANEGARAAIAGIDAGERDQLARAAVASSAGTATLINPQLLTTTLSLNGSYLTVRLSYDATRMPLFRMSMVPLPGNAISRSATVKLYSL
jgi:Flp pilus assembly protein TadG